ncbi:unnamed protein product, partial [Sphagnum compactum]
MYPFVSNHPTTHASYSSMPGFSGLDDKSCRYTDSVMNSYPSMGVPGGASSIAQFYHQAAAVSAASAGISSGVDSLASSQLSSTGLSSVGSGQTGLPDITRHPWL